MEYSVVLNWRRNHRLKKAWPENAWPEVDPSIWPYIGQIPTLPAGSDGHKALREIFFDLFTRLKAEIFCDIGANEGEVGRQAKVLMPACTVIGFEANPVTHELFRRENERAGVIWQQRAICDKVGTLDFYVPRHLSSAVVNGRVVPADITEPATSGKVSLLKRMESADYDTLSVPATTLDDALSSYKGNAFLWIDVEGAIQQVIMGAQETLARTLIVVAEIETRSFWQGQATAASVIGHFLRLGFEPILRDREYSELQYNVLFIRRELVDEIDIHAVSERLAAAHDATRRKPGLFSRLWPRAKIVSPSDIPVLIPSFNNPTYCTSMLAQLSRLGVKNVTIIDNASSEPRMRKWLDKAEASVKVIRLSENIGPRQSFDVPEVRRDLPRHFCVTDPDLLFNPMMPTDFLHILAQEASRYRIGKVGLALDISHSHDFVQKDFKINNKLYRIFEWEEQFWKNPIGSTTHGDLIFRADIDTTLAVYDQNYFLKSDENFLHALRVAGRFTAVHLPWLPQNRLDSEEELNYRATQRYSSYLGNMMSEGF